MQYQFQKPFFTFHSDMKSSCIKKLNKDGIFANAQLMQSLSNIRKYMICFQIIQIIHVNAN